jgi:hypothetical protein
MNTASAEYEQFKARISGESAGASAAVENGELATAETRLAEALKTVRERAHASDAYHDGTGPNFQDGTGPN